ncbi:MAG: hypothetical protein ACRDJH_08070 [Thermomicrobiales bacterium]
MGMDFAERAERTTRSILDAVPGYKGYRRKEDRRDADRRVREALALRFGAQADRVERIARNLADQRRLRDVGPVDQLARSIRHFVDRVSTATYGYGGLFGDRDVDERALEQIRQFDESLLSGVDELDQPIADLERAYAEGTDLASSAGAGAEIVRDLLARFDLRGQVVESAEPATEESVLKHLKPAPVVESHPAFDLHDRDAIAIMGDNYVVDARIDVQAVPDSFRLFRVSDEAKAWLFVPKVDGQTFALLHDSDDSGEESEIDGVAYTVQSSGSGTGELIGAGGHSGVERVAYRFLVGTEDAAARAVVLTWSNERQTFAGKETHPDDVEMYGSKHSAG